MTTASRLRRGIPRQPWSAGRAAAATIAVAVGGAGAGAATQAGAADRVVATPGAPAAPVLPVPLADPPGDAARGRAVVASRATGLCLLCHAAPIAEERFQGNLGPDLAGVGARYDAAQLRRRLVDPRALNPESIMPAAQHTEGLTLVGTAWQGKPVLTSQQVEDVVAWLATLK